MKMFSHMPETPITEQMQWHTQAQVSENGTELRISLRDNPKRTVKAMHVFDSDSDITLSRQIIFSDFDKPFILPFYQHMTRLTANAAIADTALALRTDRTELRDGCNALLIDRGGNTEQVVIDTVGVNTVSLADPLVGAWTIARGAAIVPAWTVYVGNNAQITRLPVNVASITMQAAETEFMIPFLNPDNDTALTMFAGLPVVIYNSIGEQFDEQNVNGSQPTDYGGLVSLRTPWNHQQLQLPRSFLCNRVWNRSAWEWWNAFADYCKGSANPFFLPTFRNDFIVTTPPAPSGATLDFQGLSYKDDYFPYSAFKHLAIFTLAGVHYCTVTSVTNVGGNSHVTFTPALPAGSDYAVDQVVSLLLKSRIADDIILCEHTILQTRIDINFMTVDA